MFLLADKPYPPSCHGVLFFGQHSNLTNSLSIPLLQQNYACSRPFALALSSVRNDLLALPLAGSFLNLQVQPKYYFFRLVLSAYFSIK